MKWNIIVILKIHEFLQFCWLSLWSHLYNILLCCSPFTWLSSLSLATIFCKEQCVMPGSQQHWRSWGVRL